MGRVAWISLVLGPAQLFCIRPFLYILQFTNIKISSKYKPLRFENFFVEVHPSGMNHPFEQERVFILLVITTVAKVGITAWNLLSFKSKWITSCGHLLWRQPALYWVIIFRVYRFLDLCSPVKLNFEGTEIRNSWSRLLAKFGGRTRVRILFHHLLIKRSVICFYQCAGNLWMLTSSFVALKACLCLRITGSMILCD